MKPFEYVAARTIDEAVEALASSKGPAKPLAGGTDLVVQTRRGAHHPRPGGRYRQGSRIEKSRTWMRKGS